MENVPKIISTKDMAYLNDIFEWNFNLSKKANHFSKEVSNERIRNFLIDISKMHTDHCHIILNMLGDNYE